MKLAMMRSLLMITVILISTNHAQTMYSFNSSNKITSAGVSCGDVETCIINCIGEYSCRPTAGATINGTQATHLQINCIGTLTCYSIEVYGPIQTNSAIQTSLNVICDSEGGAVSNYNLAACVYADFYASNTSIVNIDCVSQSDCYWSVIEVHNVFEKATINAGGRWSLRYAKIFANNANSLEINCIDKESCYTTSIWANPDITYGTFIHCHDANSSCYKTNLRVPDKDVLPNNYMQLQCAEPTNGYDVCGVQFRCDDSSQPSWIEWVTDDNVNWYYDCLSIGDDYNCCPWGSPDVMIKPPTSSPTPATSVPSAAPTSNTEQPTEIPTEYPTVPTTTQDPSEMPSKSPIATTEPSQDVNQTGGGCILVPRFLILSVVYMTVNYF